MLSTGDMYALLVPFRTEAYFVIQRIDFAFVLISEARSTTFFRMRKHIAFTLYYYTSFLSQRLWNLYHDETF